jgi:phage terminase large subunit GpA-like protein
MARSDLTRVLSVGGHASLRRSRLISRPLQREEERNMEHAKALERAIRDKLINPAHGDRDQ